MRSGPRNAGRPDGAHRFALEGAEEAKAPARYTEGGRVMEAKRIVNRCAVNSYEAWRWANVAAGLGWRVVSVFQGDSGEGWAVWAEAPASANAGDWDRAFEEDGGE